MAKVTKATREVMNVDDEIRKVSKVKKEEKAKKDVKGNKKNTKTKSKTNNKKTSFIKEVRKEMSKVKWPSRKEMVKYSFATISFIIFFAVFFYVIEVVIALLKAWV